MTLRAPPRIELQNVTLGYDKRPAVHHLSGVIEPGELLAVCGPNGGGKSTLLKGLAGLLNPIGGRIECGGLKFRDFAYLPQACDIDRSFPIDVRDFAALGSIRRAGLFGRLGADEDTRVTAALQAVGLRGFETRAIETLSGGQMQRALFARLMVEDEAVILLDEPFGAIDAATTDDLLALIAGWRAEGRTVIAALHEFDLVQRAFPKTLLIARDAVFWGATKDAFAPEHLLHARLMPQSFLADAQLCRRDDASGRADAV